MHFRKKYMKYSFENLKELNNSTISYLKEMGLDYSNNLNISKLLDDESCFFKLSKSKSIKILSQIGVSDKLKLDYYNFLTSEKNFDLVYLNNKIDVKKINSTFLPYLDKFEKTTVSKLKPSTFKRVLPGSYSSNNFTQKPFTLSYIGNNCKYYFKSNR